MIEDPGPASSRGRIVTRRLVITTGDPLSAHRSLPHAPSPREMYGPFSFYPGRALPERTMASTVSTNPGISCISCGSAADALPTVGVEEEFLLDESGTGTPCLCNTAVAETGSDLGIALQLELSRAIETATRAGRLRR
ncbi:hypothetical protein [Rhodococcus koreensis]|uniref:hypothetical protein n=1 Tax=Rhodococcus koreensis TaxID=99653 RepID=UPI00197D1690|nr:hypothetical protein JWS14_39060 [Rhodococcus koreensis]